MVLMPASVAAAPPPHSSTWLRHCGVLALLGAGIIINDSGEEEVKGLTTAAGIWLTATIGVAVGMGREATAVSSALLALVILYTVPRVARLESRGREFGRGDIR